VIDVNVRLDAVVGLNSEVAHASPTDTLKSDVITALLSDSSVLTGIDKLVVVDSGGVERDSVTVATADFQPVTGGYKVSKQFKASASYTAAKVRAYSGTKLYFEGSLPSPVSVVANATYTLTFTFTVSLSISVFQSPSTVQSTGENISVVIARRLIGEYADSYGNQYNLVVDKVWYMTPDGAIIMEVPLTRDLSTKTFGHPARAFPSSTVLGKIQVNCVYEVAGFYIVIAPINVTTADTISMSFTVSA
jgi:hypothetical protein